MKRTRKLLGRIFNHRPTKLYINCKNVRSVMRIFLGLINGKEYCFNSNEEAEYFSKRANVLLNKFLLEKYHNEISNELLYFIKWELSHEERKLIETDPIKRNRYEVGII